MTWLVGLNSLRFLAIILIVVYHLFRTFLPGGFIAVEVFFLISGFLIFSKLIHTYAQTGKIHYLRFLRERFLKLFPPMLVMVTLSLCLALFVSRDLLQNIQLRSIAALGFFTNLFELFTGGSYENQISPNIFEHTWFIALLFQFYLVFTLFAKLFLLQFRKRRTAIWALFFAFLVFALISDLLMILYGAKYAAINRSYFAIDTHAGSFCLGASFAALNYLIPRTPRTPKFIPSLGLAFSILLLCIFSFKARYDDMLTFGFVLPFAGVLSLIMLVCIIKLQPNQDRRQRIPLWLRLSEKLGALSFGVYLFHFPFQILLSEILPPFYSSLSVSIVTIISSILLAHLFTEKLNLIDNIHHLRWPFTIRQFVAILAAILSVVGASWLTFSTPFQSEIAQQLANQPRSSAPQIDTSKTSDIFLLNYSTSTANHALTNIFQQDLSLSPSFSQNRAAESANLADVLLIGDSVALGAKSELETMIPNIYVDAKESRGIESATGILANYAALGKLSKNIIISLATNERTITAKLLQNIVDLAGNDRVYILVTAYAGPQQARDQQNAALSEFAKTHQNVYLADWWSIAHDNWSLLYADHIHLNPAGRRSYAELILETIKRVEQ